jgi:hypothetical protein
MAALMSDASCVPGLLTGDSEAEYWKPLKQIQVVHDYEFVVMYSMCTLVGVLCL